MILPRTETVGTACHCLTLVQQLCFSFSFQINLASFGGTLQRPLRLNFRENGHLPFKHTHDELSLNPVGMRSVHPLPPHPGYNPLGTRIPSEQNITLILSYFFFLNTVSPGLKEIFGF